MTVNKTITDYDSAISIDNYNDYLLLYQNATNDYRKVNRNVYIGNKVEKGSESINVLDYGAKGDGITDDTIAINGAIIAANAAGGKTVYFPGGTYMIKAHDPTQVGVTYLVDGGGIKILDNVSLLLEDSAILQAIPNGEKAYAVVYTYSNSNVSISGGTIKGERNDHTGVTGECGFGISIAGGKNINISNITIQDCWGDGIITLPTALLDNPYRIQIDNVVCDGNRRQGMSICAGRYISVTNSAFANTSGTLPATGVDIEPIDDTIPVKQVTFENCRFLNNDNAGLFMMTGAVNKVSAENCYFSGNCITEASGQITTYMKDGCKDFSFRNNTFENEVGGMASMMLAGGQNYVVDGNSFSTGMFLRFGPEGALYNASVTNNVITTIVGTTPLASLIRQDNASNVVYSGNVINAAALNPSYAAIYVLGDSANTQIIGNRILNCPNGIALGDTSSVSIVDNVLENNGTTGISLSGADLYEVDITGNSFYASCHSNSGGATIYNAQAGATKVSIRNNFATQTPRDATTAGFGANFSATFIGVVAGAGVDTFTSGNVLVKDAGSVSFNLTATALVPTEGYLGDRYSGMMKGITAQKPSAPVEGMTFYDSTLKKSLLYNGTAWVNNSYSSTAGELGAGWATTFAPSWINLTPGNGTLTASRFTLAGKTVNWMVVFTLGSTSSVSGSIVITLPITPHASYTTSVPIAKVVYIIGGVAYFGYVGGTGILYAEKTDGTYNTRAATAAAVPNTFADGSIITIVGQYEAA